MKFAITKVDIDARLEYLKYLQKIFFRKCNATKKSARKIIYNSMNDFKTQEYHTVK